MGQLPINQRPIFLEDLYESVSYDLQDFKLSLSKKDFNLALNDLIDEQAAVLFNRGQRVIVATQHGFYRYGIQ